MKMGSSPITRNISGKIIKICSDTKTIMIKEPNTGKLYQFFYPNFDNKIKLNDIIIVSTPIKGRAESVSYPYEDIDIGKLLLQSYDLMEKGKFEDAQKNLEMILEKDPGNPLALNNLAAMMVKKKKFDKAVTYLKQALPRAKGYMVQINRVCQVGGICLAFKPVTSGTGNQDLEPLVMLNIDMVKQYMAQEPLSR